MEKELDNMKTKRFFAGILCALLIFTAIPCTTHAATTHTASLSAVSGLKTTSRTSSSVSISWNGVAGATKYEVYRAYAFNGTYSLIATMSGTSYNPSGLSSGREYYYKVRAVSGSTKGKFSGRLSSYTKGGSKKGRIQSSGSKVNVRKHAGTNYGALTSLSKGTTVTIVADTQTKRGEHWYRIHANVSGRSVNGYVRADLVGNAGSSNPSKPSNGKQGRVNVSSGTNLNIRSSASTSARVVVKVQRGQIVTILGRATGSGMTWYRVSFVKNGKTYTGYAAAQYISLI